MPATPAASPFKTYLVDPVSVAVRPFAAHPVASVVLMSILLAAGGASVYYKIHTDYSGIGATVLACLLVGVPGSDVSPPLLGAVAVLGAVSVAYYPTWANGPMTWLFLGQLLVGSLAVRLGLLAVNFWFRHLFELCVTVVFIVLLAGAYYCNNLRKEAAKNPYDIISYAFSLLWGLLAEYSKRG